MEEYAYLAGIIDGEGTISLTRNGAKDKFRRIVISVPSTSLELIQYLHRTFGGTVVTRTSRQAHHLTCRVWQVRNDNALDILSKILPHLRITSKIDRANLLINEYKGLVKRNGRYTDAEIEARLAFEERFLSLVPC